MISQKSLTERMGLKHRFQSSRLLLRPIAGSMLKGDIFSTRKSYASTYLKGSETDLHPHTISSLKIPVTGFNPGTLSMYLL